MSAPRFLLTIEIPGTSLKKTVKLKTHLRRPEDLAAELSLVDWKSVFHDMDFDEIAREWSESYLKMLERMESK